jgi:hypothetical protein
MNWPTNAQRLANSAEQTPGAGVACPQREAAPQMRLRVEGARHFQVKNPIQIDAANCAFNR